MRVTVAMLVVLASLSACGGGGGAEDSSVGDRRLSADDTSVSVFKSNGATQCAGNGLSLTAMQGQLTAVNVEVRSAACGGDGRMYPTVCGAPVGSIGIFQIPAAQVPAATEAGFVLLSTNPDARVVPCN